MGAEFFIRRAFGIETLEDRLEFAFGDAGALVFDGDATPPGSLSLATLPLRGRDKN